jgi:single-strand DNA-binding protein
MASMKKLILIGNIGSAPELKILTSGVAVCHFNVATNEYTRDAEGLSTETTTWYRVSLFRNPAENAAAMLKSGMSVQVVGDVKVNKFKGNDGATRFSLDVTASEYQILAPAKVKSDAPVAAPVAVVVKTADIPF